MSEELDLNKCFEFKILICAGGGGIITAKPAW